MKSTVFSVTIILLISAIDLSGYGLKKSVPPAFKARKEARAKAASGAVGTQASAAAKPTGKRMKIPSSRRTEKAGTAQKTSRVSLRDISRQVTLNVNTATKQQSAVLENKFKQQLPLIIKEGIASSAAGDFFIGSFYSPDTGKNYSAYIRK